MLAALSADRTPRNKATSWPKHSPRRARWACRTTGARSATRPRSPTARSCRLFPLQTGSSSTLAFSRACASTGENWPVNAAQPRSRSSLNGLNLMPVRRPTSVAFVADGCWVNISKAPLETRCSAQLVQTCSRGFERMV